MDSWCHPASHSGDAWQLAVKGCRQFEESHRMSLMPYKKYLGIVLGFTPENRCSLKEFCQDKHKFERLR